jgi:hypothetical protein
METFWEQSFHTFKNSVLAQLKTSGFSCEAMAVSWEGV